MNIAAKVMHQCIGLPCVVVDDGSGLEIAGGELFRVNHRRGVFTLTNTIYGTMVLKLDSVMDLRMVNVLEITVSRIGC